MEQRKKDTQVNSNACSTDAIDSSQNTTMQITPPLTPRAAHNIDEADNVSNTEVS